MKKISLLLVTLLCGCSLFSMGENLQTAMLNHNDPETVEAAIPAYLLVADSLVVGDGKDEDYLLSAAKLYAIYAAAFVTPGERAKLLSDRALSYADRGLCEAENELCALWDKPADEVKAVVANLGGEDLTPLYVNATCKLLWIAGHSDDWSALAQLPKVQYVFEKVIALDDSYDNGGGHLYLGVLNTLRPPALGGLVEEGRKHFERAIEISGGKNLSYKVEFAKRYARMVFDRELHDKLLNEVLAATAEQKDLTLVNILAKRGAKELLASADEYF